MVIMEQVKNRSFTMNSNVEEIELNTNIVTVFDQIAKDNSTRVAYDEMGKQTSYGELKANSDSLAAWLTKQNMTRQSPILVFGDHQVEMITSFLAALKAGHPYIPVSTDSAIPRIQSILDTAKPELIIAVDDFPSDNLNFDARVISNEQLTNVLAAHQEFTPTDPVSGDELERLVHLKGWKLAMIISRPSSIGFLIQISIFLNTLTSLVNRHTHLTYLTCTGCRHY